MSAREARDRRFDLSQICDSLGMCRSIQCGLISNRFSFRCRVARLTPSALAAADTLPLDCAAAHAAARYARTSSKCSSRAARPIDRSRAVGLHRAIERDAECRTGRPRRADHEVVGIDRQQTAAAPFGRRRQYDPRLGERRPEQIRFDAPSGLAGGESDQACECVGAVGPAGGDVERAGKPCLVIDRSERAVQLKSVLRVKKCWSRSIVSRALFDEAGADAVGALVLLAPDRAGPQVPRIRTSHRRLRPRDDRPEHRRDPRAERNSRSRPPPDTVGP